MSYVRRMFSPFWSRILLTSLLFASPAMAAPTKISIATVSKGSAQEWILFIARDEGFLAKRGIELDSFSTGSPSLAMQTLAGGSADMATSGLPDPLRAIGSGAHLSLLRVETRLAPYSLSAKPNIKTVAELRHKVISVAGIKDISRIYLERFLIPRGLKPSDYDMVFAGSTSTRYAALVSGAVDAAIMLPPFSFKADAAGFSDLGYLADPPGELPFTAFAVNTAWAKSQKPLVLAFLSALTEATDWFYDDANRAQAIEILHKESKVERHEVEMTYDLYRRLKIFDRRGSIANGNIGNLIKAMTDVGDLHGAPVVARYLDKDIAQYADESQ